jgi:hypothetical protein
MTPVGHNRKQHVHLHKDKLSRQQSVQIRAQQYEVIKLPSLFIGTE